LRGEGREGVFIQASLHPPLHPLLYESQTLKGGDTVDLAPKAFGAAG